MGSDAELLDIDCLMHELAETVVNNVWKTNTTGGEWEVADVCDGFFKTLPDNTTIGGAVNVTFGNITVLTGQYLYDMVAQECSCGASGSSPAQEPNLGPTDMMNITKAFFSTLHCSAPAVMPLATTAWIVIVACLVVVMAITLVMFLRRLWHVEGLRQARAMLAVLSAAGAFTATVIAAVTDTPPAPPKATSPWFYSEGAWATEFLLSEVAVKGSVFSPFRETLTDHTVQVTLASASLIIAAANARSPSTALELVGGVAAAMLFGCSILPHASIGIAVASLLAALCHAFPIAGRLDAPEVHAPLRNLPVLMVTAAVLDFVLGVLLLARRDDAASLTVTGLYDIGGQVIDANLAAACSLAASCGYDPSSGMPYVPFFDTHPMRFGVRLTEPSALTGSFALIALVTWSAACLKTAAAIPAVVFQAAVFGTWIPMIGPLSRRSLVPGVVAQAAASLGLGYSTNIPSHLKPAMALSSTAFAAGVLCAVPLRGVWVRVVSARNGVKEAHALLGLAVVITALVLESRVGPPGEASFNPNAYMSYFYFTYSANATVGIPKIDTAGTVFNPLRDVSRSFPAVICVSIVATVAAAMRTWPRSAMVLSATTFGVTLPTLNPTLSVFAGLAWVLSLFAPPAPSVPRDGYYAAAAACVIADTVAMGFSFRGVHLGQTLTIALSPDGARGPFVDQLLGEVLSWSASPGLIGTVFYTADVSSLCAISGALSTAALAAWGASALSRNWRALCLACCLQCVLAGACIPFQAMTLRRSLLPTSIVQIASVLGWSIRPDLPAVAAAASWCSVLAAVAGVVHIVTIDEPDYESADKSDGSNNVDKGGKTLRGALRI